MEFLEAQHLTTQSALPKLRFWLTFKMSIRSILMRNAESGTLEFDATIQELILYEHSVKTKINMLKLEVMLCKL